MYRVLGIIALWLVLLVSVRSIQKGLNLNTGNRECIAVRQTCVSSLRIFVM